MNSRPGYAVALRRNVPSLILGSFATSDSETLAVTQTDAQIGQHEKDVVQVGLLAGDGVFLDDRAVEGRDDPVEGHVFIHEQSRWLGRHGRAGSGCLPRRPGSAIAGPRR